MSRIYAAFALPFVAAMTLAIPASAQTSILTQRLAGAKPGTVIMLPAGVIAAEGEHVPAGVTLRGAGYAKTILDASGAGSGLTIDSANGATVTDLTIQNASGSAIAVTDSAKVILSRLRLLGSGIGVKLDGVTHGRIENVVSARNKIGFILAKSSDTDIVSCTAANNAVMSIGVSGDTHCAIFDDVFVGAPTGISLAVNNGNMLIDHNFYVASFTGKFGMQPARRSVASWCQDSGVDSHSATHQIDFADAKGDIYRPITPVEWRPIAAVTSGWGVPSMDTFAAPAADIDGQARGKSWDAGAYQVSFPASRPPDGRFTISSPDGVKSAGLYTTDGVQVRPLFNNQPLPPGVYQFWLPSRTVTGAPIAAGNYEVRVAESALSLSYIAMTGNGGISNEPPQFASLGPERAVFDSQGRIILAQSGVENGIFMRSFEPGLGRARWSIPGNGDCRGLAIDGAGKVYALTEMAADGTARMIIADAETGKLQPVEGDKYNTTFTGVFSPKVNGMAELAGTLYVADPAKDALLTASPSDLSAWKTIAIPSPSSPAADPAHNLIWLISAGSVIAVDPTGAVKAKGPAVDQPSSLSVAGGYLAVGSQKDRKVTIFDIGDPAAPKVVRTVGTGEQPYGPMRPDKLIDPTSVTMAADGSLFVVDWQRASLFGPDGAVKASEMGSWDQRVTLARFAGDSRVHVFNLGGAYSFVLDPKTKTWQPGTYYHLPTGPCGDGYPYGFYSADGKNYGVYPGNVAGKPAVNVALIDGDEMKWITAYSYDDKQGTMVVRHDSNGDGVIDSADPAAPLADAAGKPLPNFAGSVTGIHDDGSLIASDPADAGAVSMTVPLKTAATGEYDWAGRKPIIAQIGAGNSFTSPYDFSKTESASPVTYADMPGGGVFGVSLKSGGGAGFSGGSTDLIGIGGDGKMRWFYPVNPPPMGRGIGVRALQSIAGVILANDSTEDEFTAIDPSGLGLGLLGPPPGQHWLGMWVDGDAQVRTFTDETGQPYVVVGDYATQALHWMALNGAGQIHRSTVPVTISAPAAAVLAALPAVPLTPLPLASMPVPTLSIKHLAAPLTIDGDPQKWRTIGLDPQIVMTPDTGSGFSGPADCSAVVRMAYEGNNLYVQAIRFDDVVTFHQPLSMAYKADALEMEMNGFFSGYKYTIARTTDKGDVIFREEFLIPSATLILDPAKAPLSIKVYDDAKSFPERKIFEDVYGVDLSNSKVIVTEFKLPMDYAYGTKLPFKMEPGGGTFWLGFFVDDNDLPGSDLQRFIPWPATFLVYLNPDQGALASFAP